MPVDLTAQLPVEVLLGIFDCLCLSELAHLISVSTRWATVIKAHRSYWSFPQLTVTTPSAVVFFRSRICATSGRPFDVRLVILEPFPLLETALLPDLAQHLDCIVTLIIHVHISHSEAVWALLHGSASALRFLQLFFEVGKVPNSTQSSVVALPADILSRNPPGGLETVLLQNIDVVHPPPALSRAVNLVFSQKSSASCTTLHALAAAFPCACDVSLISRALRKDVEPSDWPARWEYLDSLTIAGKKSRRAIRALPLENVSHLIAVEVGQREVDHLLVHLLGDLHMSFRDLDTGDFLIHLASWTDGCARSFREQWNSWLSPAAVPHDLLWSAFVLDRVISLTIPLSAWRGLVVLLGPVNQLLQLTLVLSRAYDIAHLLSGDCPGVIVCPSLRTLCLAAVGSPMTVAPNNLTRFIVRYLRAPVPIGVVLKNVCTPEWPKGCHLVSRVDQSALGELYLSTPWHMQ